MSVKEFNNVLRQIAERFDLDGAALVRYAREDKRKGQDKGNENGTAYTNDGKLLYAMVRLLRPDHILEIGTYKGGGTIHLAEAVKKNGAPEKMGVVLSVDIWEGSGLAIPDELMGWVEVVHQNIDFWLDEYSLPEPFFDFIFEDGPHSEHSVHNIYQALPPILKPGGFILSHDTSTGMHNYIVNGMRKGGVDLDDVLFVDLPGNPCGMSVYRFEGYDEPQASL
jgi:predicted O-methyltransferase YrrM